VSRVDLREQPPDGQTDEARTVQTIEMDTVADGGTHTTRSVRICRRPRSIAYKQLTVPAPLLGHAGLWTVSDGRIIARHTVALDPSRADRATVRDLLGANSRTTLAAAKDHAEARLAARGPS
jgi:aromatase